MFSFKLYPNNLNHSILTKNVKALDSFGRRPSGIEMGNLIWAGEYDQCVSINEAKWSGKYCYYQKYDELTNFVFVNILEFFVFKLSEKFNFTCKRNNSVYFTIE